MLELSLTPKGLFVSGRAVALPMSLDELARLAPLGEPDVAEHGTLWPLDGLPLSALESTTIPDDPERPVEELRFHPARCACSFEIDGVPWTEVEPLETPFGRQLFVGGWVIGIADDHWSIYVDPDAEARASVERVVKKDPKLRKPKPSERPAAKPPAAKPPAAKPPGAKPGAGDPFAAVEARFGVRLPALFRRLWSDRGFDASRWGRRRRAAVLHADIDFCPITPKKLLRAADELAALGVEVDALRIVPFAETEQGDRYCLLFERPNSASPAVVLLPVDEERGRYVAKNLVDFLFRRTVEAIGSCSEDERAAASAMAEALRPYVSAKRLKVAVELAERPELPVSARTIASLVKQELAFPSLGKSVRLRQRD